MAIAMIVSGLSSRGLAQANSLRGVRNIVLVHGAWADGSCWSRVIALLQAKGFHVVAVQNPLTSLAADVAATKRIIALQDGPVILVGHSYAGVVITEAGNDAKVSGWFTWRPLRLGKANPSIPSPSLTRLLRWVASFGSTLKAF